MVCKGTSKETGLIEVEEVQNEELWYVSMNWYELNQLMLNF